MMVFASLVYDLKLQLTSPMRLFFPSPHDLGTLGSPPPSPRPLHFWPLHPGLLPSALTMVRPASRHCADQGCPPWPRSPSWPGSPGCIHWPSCCSSALAFPKRVWAGRICGHLLGPARLWVTNSLLSWPSAGPPGRLSKAVWTKHCF